MLHKTFILVWLSLCSLTSYAQQTGELFNQTIVQEKVYLHIDNNCYFAGDTIWYKAYVVRADNHRPTDISRVLYVELLNEQGYLVERQQLVVDYDGQANGQFALNDSAWAGYYEVRAYTKWMMNFGHEKTKRWAGERRSLLRDGRTRPEYGKLGVSEVISHETAVGSVEAEMGKINMREIKFGEELAYYDSDGTVSDYENGLTVEEDAERLRFRSYSGLFSRVIPVYQKPAKPSLYNSKVMPVKITMGDFKKVYTGKDFNMEFYPEGGHLVYGHKFRVAWEARDIEGRRMNVSGVLLQDGAVIDSIKPVHAGRGDFWFNPQRGHSYKVKIFCGDKTFSPSLPKIEDEGCSVSVGQGADSVTFTVYKTLPGISRLYLSFLCRGRMTELLSLDMADGKTRVKLPKSLFPAGVNQVTLFDEAERIYSDRLFFVADTEDALCNNVAVKTKGTSLKPYEKISIDLKATRPDGSPLARQTFSLSVRDEGRLDETFNTGSIMTELLLQSDLKGFVENPDWYFVNHAWRALDDLMLVQGWRRYEWKDALHPDSLTIDYQPERNMVIHGKAYTIRKAVFQKAPGPIQVFCSLRMPLSSNDSVTLYQGKILAGADGRFNIEYQPFYGEAQLILRGKYVNKFKKSDYEHLLHDPSIFIRKEYFFPNYVRGYDWYEINQPEYTFDKSLVGRSYDKDSYYGTTLPEVLVKSKRRAHQRRLRDKPVFSIDALDYENWMWDMGYYDTDYKFDNGEFDFRQFYYYLVNSTFGRYVPDLNEEAILCFNWTMVEVNTMLPWRNRFFTFLKRIDVVTDDPLRPVPYQIYHLDRKVNRNPDILTQFTAGSYASSKFINVVTYPEDNRPIRDGREYHFKGFNRPAEFYSPDYSQIPLPEVPDVRHTLYWNPSVTTDAEGRAHVEFYNNDVCTDLNVEVEGVTKDGKFVVNF
ncbi:MAG: hypothetical protein IJ635_01685 [Bacteroidaceae bacterium]|nr:hypothetical protein [Bacteroidaceae bacterium]